jgi:hypothetical protein
VLWLARPKNRIMNEIVPEAGAGAMTLEDLRSLKGHETVRRGDFESDGHKGYALWVGPAGFRADSFVKQIYRRRKLPPAGATIL